ncbi:hypothetical protein PRZ48_003914 [Zasmidium cellare]|uniref:Uncharacterized protein n=1 Tax=Zasmidium cellare TaxID=395010 RepID=A0ABR0EX65_ZASCE|nr:hypothetical protein PRZ48_003914 [Zasmidium cellare]
MDGRNYSYNTSADMPSTSFFDFDSADTYNYQLPTTTSTATPSPNSHTQQNQTYYAPPTPRYQTPPFQRIGYPAPNMGYNNPYPAGSTPINRQPNFQLSPPQPQMTPPQSASWPLHPAHSNNSPAPIIAIDPALLTNQDTYYEPLPARNDLSPTPQLIQGIFGALQQYVVVSGTTTAISELQQAITTEHLMIDANPQSCHDAFIESLKPLQARGAIADHQMEDAGRGRFALDELNWSERETLGIEQSDFLIDPAESVQDLGAPQFQGNVDFLLGLLRVMQKYHNFSHDTSYQLGIVTRTGVDDYAVQIFEAQRGVRADHTVWLFRECIGEYSSVESWTELWHAFVVRPDAIRSTQQISPHSDEFLFPQQYNSDPSNAGYRNSTTGTLSPARRNHRSAVSTKRGRGRPRKTASLPTFSTTSPAAYIPARHNWSGAQHTQDNVHHFQHLTDEEVLSGRVHPDDIVGTLMLRLVPNHSNSELHERINALYAMVEPGNPKQVTASSITKRWTLALQHICKREGLSRQAEMDRYHRLRALNGITGGTGGGEGPPARKKRKASEVKDEQEEAAVKREDSLDADAEFEEDDEFVAAPPARSPTRRRRARNSVDYAAAFENLEGVDEDGEREVKEEADRPGKRKRPVIEEDEGSEFEQD